MIIDFTQYESFNDRLSNAYFMTVGAIYMNIKMSLKYKILSKINKNNKINSNKMA